MWIHKQNDRHQADGNKIGKIFQSGCGYISKMTGIKQTVTKSVRSSSQEPCNASTTESRLNLSFVEHSDIRLVTFKTNETTYHKIRNYGKVSACIKKKKKNDEKAVSQRPAYQKRDNQSEIIIKLKLETNSSDVLEL